MNPESLDVSREHLTAADVDLQRHQPRRHLDDVGGQSQVQQGVGGLQAEQATTDDRARAGVTRGGLDRLQVLDRAVDEAVRGLISRHRRHERVRPGGQHQGVVAERPSVGQPHQPSLAVDPDGLRRQLQSDRGVRVVPVRQQRQVLSRGAREVVRQAYPVVGRPRFLAQHGDFPAGSQSSFGRGGHELVTHHAVAHDDQRTAVRHRWFLQLPAGPCPDSSEATGAVFRDRY